MFIDVLCQPGEGDPEVQWLVSWSVSHKFQGATFSIPSVVLTNLVNSYYI